MNHIGEHYLGFSYRNELYKNSTQNNRSSVDGTKNIISEEKKTDQNTDKNRIQSVDENKTNKEKTKNELSDSDKKRIKELEKTDRKVRQHEAAHMSAAGGVSVSGPSYEFKKGPDGKMYAVGGEVKISMSSVKGDPEATMRKAEQVKNAALAPSDPSSQDRSVAAKASQMAGRARMELIKQNIEESDINKNDDNDKDSLSIKEKKGVEEYSKVQVEKNSENEKPEINKYIDIDVQA